MFLVYFPLASFSRNLNTIIFSLLTTSSALGSCEIPNTLLPLLGTTWKRVLHFGVVVDFGIGICELGLL